MIASDIIYEDEITLIMDQEPKQIQEKEKQNIMKEIEQKTEKRLNHAFQTNLRSDSNKNINAQEMDKIVDLLQNIMKKGSEEFKQKTGRQMTYGEMREMYG